MISDLCTFLRRLIFQWDWLCKHGCTCTHTYILKFFFNQTTWWSYCQTGTALLTEKTFGDNWYRFLQAGTVPVAQPAVQKHWSNRPYGQMLVVYWQMCVISLHFIVCCRSSSASIHHWMYRRQLECNELQLGTGSSGHWNWNNPKASLADSVSFSLHVFNGLINLSGAYRHTDGVRMTVSCC